MQLTKFFNPFSRGWQFRELIYGMAKREILSRYRGSWLGVLWTLVTPVLLLLVYMFVFGLIFKARWPQSSGVDEGFASLLFCGIIVYLMFSEILTRSPRLVVDNANYVKKVVFPLEIMSWVALVNSLFHFLIACGVLLAFLLLSGKGLAVTLLLLPLLMLQFILFLAGLSWFLGALGVYVRDVTYVSGFLATAMTFLSPVFYPASAVPEKFRFLMDINPLTYYIESFRKLLVLGEMPNPISALIALLVSGVMFYFGYWFFHKVRKGFADVL